MNISQLSQQLPGVLDQEPFNNLTTTPINDTVDIPAQSICSNQTIRDAAEMITSEQLLIDIICGGCSELSDEARCIAKIQTAKTTHYIVSHVSVIKECLHNLE